MPCGILKSIGIAGISAAVPSGKDDLSGFRETFGSDAVDKFIKMTGVKSRRLCSESETAADLCFASARTLMDKTGWEPKDVKALIFVSQTPDYRLPATACVLHGRLGLSMDCVAFDVNLGCSGYVYGLYIAASLIGTGSADKVLLLCGDTLDKLVSPRDRSCAMLFGDAGSATAIERRADAPDIAYLLKTDGLRYDNIIVPDGAFRNYSNRTVASENNAEERTNRDLFLDGANVFNFSIGDVPETISEFTNYFGIDKAGVDRYFLHQANLFMIKTIAKKIGVPMEKIPLTIDRYGNTSLASIPLGICAAAAELKGFGRCVNLILCGFGMGLSWGAASMTLSPDIPLELIDFADGEGH